MINFFASARDHSLQGRDLGGEVFDTFASPPFLTQITAARYPEISRRRGGRDRPGIVGAPLTLQRDTHSRSRPYSRRANG